MTRPEAVTLCREMYASRWSLTEIQRYLAGHGVNVHSRTVRRWADPEWEERQKQRLRAYQRTNKRTSARSRHPRIIDEHAVRTRAETLDAAGLDARGIRIVLGVDLGVQTSTHAVRHLLTTGEMTASLKRAVSS